MRTLLSLLLVAALALACQPEQKFDIAGSWKDPGYIRMGSGTAYRTFTLTTDRWDLVVEAYSDSFANNPSFKLEIGGAYTLGQAVELKNERGETIPYPTREGDFAIEYKRLTLLTDDTTVIKALGVGGCGLVKNQPMELKEQGCSFFTSVKDYPKEYDLVALSQDGGRLYFGERPADGNMGSPEKRPKALGSSLDRQSAESAAPAAH